MKTRVMSRRRRKRKGLSEREGGGRKVGWWRRRRRQNQKRGSHQSLQLEKSQEKNPECSPTYHRPTRSTCCRPVSEPCVRVYFFSWLFVCTAHPFFFFFMFVFADLSGDVNAVARPSPAPSAEERGEGLLGISGLSFKADGLPPVGDDETMKEVCYFCWSVCVCFRRPSQQPLSHFPIPNSIYVSTTRQRVSRGSRARGAPNGTYTRIHTHPPHTRARTPARAHAHAFSRPLVFVFVYFFLPCMYVYLTYPYVN